MRQRLLINGLAIVLFVSGWGGVFAAAMCRHTERAGTTAASDTEELPACCRAEGQEATHCSMPQGAQAQPDAETEHHDAAQAAVDAQGEHAFAHPNGACRYCITPSEYPPAPVCVAEPGGSRRAHAAHAARVQKLLPALSVQFIPAIIPSQGAPPGSRTTRHILHSVFLI